MRRRGSVGLSRFGYPHGFSSRVRGQLVVAFVGWPLCSVLVCLALCSLTCIGTGHVVWIKLAIVPAALAAADIVTACPARAVGPCQKKGVAKR